MGKTKPRQLVAIPTKQNNISSRLIDSLNFDPDLDLQPETSWVIVKKQRITILVPPLPIADRSPQLNLEQSQSQALPRKKVHNGAEQPAETCPRLPAADERQKRSMPVAFEKGLRFKKASTAQNFPTSTEPFRQDPRMESVNQHQVRTSMTHKLLGISKTSRIIVGPRLSLYGHSDSHDGGMPLNQRLRALNLERKLQKAGGLSRWLASLGLEQFVRIFKRKGLSKFQLVNLTMKKLKDMGANAVGPRRKLMHAMDCICQPCCFEAL
ncbi:Mitogen-activated protein kinase kinase kinase [Trema orientale]|uniref:Mitogen-activated protein kinase kinase kinase n=1 Tax=Trema orientale TaxID=63057 RepID=A0A2P5EA13_TREOI|nr:Mitogen-activated protein kinase kinase kinase [Trema orientale]